MEKEEITLGVKNRTLTVRVRAWVITGLIIVGLIFYTFISLSWGATPDYISLTIIAILQIVVHTTYFSEGENYGAKWEIFTNNKKAYNEKANKINQDQNVTKLREYCLVEYEERKKQYIATEIGALGLTEDDYNELKKKSPKDILKMRTWEHNGHITHFTKPSVKRLYALLFVKLPIEPNTAELVLNGIENTKSRKIEDKSKKVKVFAFVKQVFKAIPLAVFLAYIGFYAKDGIGLADVVKMFTYLSSIVTVSVMSFIKGEECTKVYKNDFYIELSTFIDKFNEWVSKEKE